MLFRSSQSRRGAAAALILTLLTATDACKTTGQGSSQLRDLGDVASGFDVTDLSILFPVDSAGVPYPRITMSNATDAAGRILWPQQTAFQPMLEFGLGRTQGTITNAPFFTGLPKGDTADKPEPEAGLNLAGEVAAIEAPMNLPLGSPIANIGNWRVVGLRADPCAQQDSGTCNAEFRLIVQPFNGRFAMDTAAHLLFNMGHLSVNGKSTELDQRNPALPADVTFQGLLRDLAAIKAAAAAAGGGTDGVPLGTHPGLVAELSRQGGAGGNLGNVGRLVDQLIKTYTQQGLTVVTTMQLVTPPLPWVFYQGTVTNGVWSPISITGGSPQMSVRFSGGATGFQPRPQNASGINNSAVLGGAPTAQDFATVFVVDNPGRFGGQQARNSVNNTDCLSCHVGATALQDNPGMSAVAQGIGRMYVPADGITGYSGTGNSTSIVGPAQAVAANVWDFRNFGFNDNQLSSSLETRMLNEAAEAARFVNEDILQVANPGFVCQPGASEQQKALNHARLWDCNIKGRTPFRTCAQQMCPNATGGQGGGGGGLPPLACTFGAGGVCGSNLGLDNKTLFQCINGKPQFLASCPNGCKVNPGVADSCREGPTPGNPPCNFGAGGVCGSNLGLDPNSLFECRSGGVQLLQHCANGCQINPGVADTCINNSGGGRVGVTCNVSPTPSCGQAFGQDPNTLFACVNGSVMKLLACSNGCKVNAAGVADVCTPPVNNNVPCPFGPGGVCGSQLGLDRNTLFQCINGRASFVAACPSGCVDNPGQPDSCAFAVNPTPTPLVACFTDATPSCGIAFGVDPNSLFACQNNLVQKLRSCPNGCTTNGVGVPDACR